MKGNQEVRDAGREMGNRSHILIIFMIILFSVSAFGAEVVKQPNVAGQFYPADKNELSKGIDGYLKGYKVIGGEGELIALIVPHAGYQYSGKVAGYAYKQLTNKNFDTVIIMGPSHYTTFDGLSVIPDGEYETPIGRVKIDKETASSLMSFNPKIKYVRESWDKEHSVEVQIPFLQKTLKNFKIVPIVFGAQSTENSYVLAQAILKFMDTVPANGKKKNILLVASTDMSHYRTSEVAGAMDAAAIDAISKGDLGALVQKLATGECEMCGYGPVITAMMVADQLGANSYEILKYADTGDVTGDKSSVVGYMSAAIYRRPLVLDEFEKNRLLEIARKTLEGYLSTKQKPVFLVYEKELLQKAGVFVTLTKNGQLRGCIGYLKPVKPLYEAVSNMAIAAATADTRFTAVTTEELPDIRIEISVLSPMERISNLDEVVVGKHGLFLVNGMQNGVLLPQVATENKWTREKFLENVCYKAGLPASVLKDPETRLYVFTADVFKEE
jgi:AmmeMemoRadiSam system protein B/AmmeMemoRadiSam system protein A